MSAPNRRWYWRLLRAILLLVVCAVLLPYLIVPVYRFVDPVSTIMAWRWLTGARVERQIVPLSDMGQLPRTVIVAEDAAFCSHSGVDLRELYRVFRNADDLSDMRGASGITQQVAKNLFLWQGRSYVRKALELPLALWIDLVLPKRRIMEIYLNVAEWGPGGEFGAEAGSRAAFGRSVRQLSAREAALMAAMLPNPRERNAKRPSASMQRIARIHEARAVRATRLTACLGRSPR